MKIIVLHPDEARELIAAAVAEGVAAALAEHARQEAAKASPVEGFVTRHEAAELLSCSLSTVDGLRREGTLAPVKLLGSIRFEKAQVLALAKRDS